MDLKCETSILDYCGTGIGAVKYEKLKNAEDMNCENTEQVHVRGVIGRGQLTENGASKIYRTKRWVRLENLSGPVMMGSSVVVAEDSSESHFYYLMMDALQAEKFADLFPSIAIENNEGVCVALLDWETYRRLCTELTAKRS